MWPQKTNKCALRQHSDDRIQKPKRNCQRAQRSREERPKLAGRRGAGAPRNNTKKAQKSRVSPGVYRLRHRGTRLRGASEQLDRVESAQKRLNSATETQRRANFRSAEAGGFEPCLPGAPSTSAGERGTNGRLRPTTLS